MLTYFDLHLGRPQDDVRGPAFDSEALLLFGGSLQRDDTDVAQTKAVYRRRYRVKAVWYCSSSRGVSLRTRTPHTLVDLILICIFGKR